MEALSEIFEKEQSLYEDSKVETIDEKTWAIGSAFLDQYGPISSHISSFNCAVSETFLSIIAEKGKIIKNINGELHSVIIDNAFYQKPTHKEVNEDIVKVTPKMCMDRGISYVSHMYVDILYEGPNGQKNFYPKKYFGDIPIMVHSDLCRLSDIKHDRKRLAELQEDVNDCGGYFILKGNPKVLIPQVRPSHNCVHTYIGKTTSSSGKPKFVKYAEIRSGNSTSHTTKVQVGIGAKTELISITVPYIDAHAIPLGIIFRALGAESEIEIASYIFETEWFIDPPTPKHKEAVMILTRSLEQSWQICTQESALDFIGRKGKKFNKKTVTKEEVPSENEDEIVEENSDDEDDIEDEKCSETISYAKHLLSVEFLPHIGVGDSFIKKKKVFLGYMTRKLLLCHVGLAPVSDRDHTANRLIHTAGMLLSSQFYKALKQLRSKIESGMEADIKKRNPINISSYITSPSIITSSLRDAIMSNKWYNKGTTQGISQALEDFNISAFICFLRKFRIPMANEGCKIELPRQQNNSQFGVECPAETPEGKQVGLVRSQVAGSIISVGCDSQPIEELVKEMDVILMDEKSSNTTCDQKSATPILKNCRVDSKVNTYDQNNFLKYTRIFVAGIPIGYTHCPEKIAYELRELRQSGSIPAEVSIVHDPYDKEIKISTSAGRCCRGLIVLDNGKMKLTEKDLDDIFEGKWSTSQKSTWMALLEGGYVEIIGKDEEEYLNVVMYPTDLDKMSDDIRRKYSHCEMSPDMALQGAAVSTSPFNNHNQSPRNIYQSAMTKQAAGIPGQNYKFRHYGKRHALIYPQKPIVQTRISKKFGFHKAPMGQNAVVLVMPWYGLGQEDSLVLNADAIERGFMCSNYYCTYEAILEHVEMPGVSKFEKFEIPTDECNDFRGNTDKLHLYTDELGQWCHIQKGQTVEKDDILIGMTVTYGHGEHHFNQSIYSKRKTNISVIYDQAWSATVHSVQCGFNGEGYLYVRLVTVQLRKPVRADKFCYTKDHEILTTQGWVGISDVTEDHEVATLRDGKFLEYQHPTDIRSYRYDKDEKVIHVETNQIDLCVTANHNMFVKTRNGKEYELIRADQLFDKHVHYKKDAEWECEGLKYFKLPGFVYERKIGYDDIYYNKKVDIEAWCMFYGLWLAEGWTREGHSVGLAVNKGRVKKPLIESLKKMRIEYTESETQEVINIYDKQLMHYMENYEISGALNKTMGQWVWKLNKKQCQILLEGMLLGDGHMNGNTPMYDTSSVKLKDDVMRLALHCGWAANAVVRYKKGREHKIQDKMTILNADSWRLTIIKSQLYPAVNKHIKGQQKWVPHPPEDKFAYCCTVPNGVLYVRNGSSKPVWCANSANHGQKGTAGEVSWPAERMPFLVEEGITPDILINPLAFPSRMTIAMLIEGVLGVEVCSSALKCPEYYMPLCADADESRKDEVMIKDYDESEYYYPEGFDPLRDYRNDVTRDGTPFIKSFDVKRVMLALKKMGLNMFCEVEVKNPITGDIHPGLSFCGIMYYQRLRHMVVDKMHARAKGGRHALHRQPVEGRKRKGGFRVGVMERDSASVLACIDLPEGVSVTLGSFGGGNFEKIWSWNQKNEGLEISSVTRYGEKKKVKRMLMTLQDGRTIGASGHHPFYTNEHEWSDINHIKINEDRIACSVSRPLVDFEKDMELCKGWYWNQPVYMSFLHKDRKLPSLYETFRRSLCLARIIGFAITDGHMVKKREKVQVYLGHELDVELILDDVERITGIRPTYKMETGQITYFPIFLPKSLAFFIRKLGVLKGAKVVQRAKFPRFIYDKDLPLPILREFLGGLFGGDGHTTCLSLHRGKRDLMKSVAFSWTRNEKYLGSLQKCLEHLQTLLLRFDIKCNIEAPKLTTNSKQSNGERNHKEIVLAIPIDYLIKFGEKIGFRYCEHKSVRLDAGMSYRRFREGIERQRQWIANRTDQLTGYKEFKIKNPTARFNGLAPAYRQAIEELKKKEAILHDKSIPTPKMIGEIITGQSEKDIHNSKGFPIVEEYLREIGALGMFLDENDPDSKKVTYGTKLGHNYLPVYWLKVIDVRQDGYEDMADIEVPGNHSFLVNGMLAHNCMWAQGVPEMTQDRLLYQSDVYRMPVCQICGLTAIDDGQIQYCKLCKTSPIVTVVLPFGTKLLNQELCTINAVPRIITLIEPKKEDEKVEKKKVNKTLKLEKKSKK